MQSLPLPRYVLTKPSTQSHSSPRLFKHGQQAVAAVTVAVTRCCQARLFKTATEPTALSRIPSHFSPPSSPTEQSTCSFPPSEVLQSDTLRGLLLLAVEKKKKKKLKKKKRQPDSVVIPSSFSSSDCLTTLYSLFSFFLDLEVVNL